MSLDAYAEQFFNFGGNTYGTPAWGTTHGAWDFGGFTGPLGGSLKEEAASEDFEAMAGGIYKASPAIFACHNYRRSLFSEARFTFQKFSSDGRPGDLQDDPELDILREPWPGADSRDLLTRAIIHADIGGNAFMVREKIDGTDQIKFLRPDWTLILMSGDPRQLENVQPVALVYKPGNSENVDEWGVYPFDGSNGRVAHWAPIPDPQAQYRGMSWFDPVIRAAITDKAMDLTKLRYFQNGARPGIIASFDASVRPEQAKQFQELFLATKTGAENSHKPMFLGGGVTVSQFKMELDDFEKISSIGELRIAAVAQVPPTLVGLTESMKGSALNQGNFQAAKDSFADGTMRPLWGSFCSAIAALVEIPQGQRLWYDDRDIAFLRQDQQLIAQRKQIDASTIARLIQDGFTPDAAVKYVMEDDFKALLGAGHTGLYSVQLMPPGLAHATDFAGDEGTDSAAAPGSNQALGHPAKPGQQQLIKQGNSKSTPTNYGTGSKRKPSPGRPTKPGGP